MLLIFIPQLQDVMWPRFSRKAGKLVAVTMV